MGLERKGEIQFKGRDVTVVGPNLTPSMPAPEFSVVDKDWIDVQGLESTRGKIRIIGSLPSINSSVCGRETRRFNQEAAALGDDIAIVMVSMDQPWTLAEWCGAAGIDKVITLSDAKSGEFGEKYGVLLKEPRILRRAVFVVDRDDKILYSAYMPSIGDEPDYEKVIAAARVALGQGPGSAGQSAKDNLARGG